MSKDSEEVIISRIWDNHGKEVGYEQKGVLVRCKDCKYAIWPNGVPLGAKGWAYSCDRKDALLGPLDDTDYCSYGERKEK